MLFTGISRTFSTVNNKQYETIGNFWDEMAKLYGRANLMGLGYNWTDSAIEYVIALKDGLIDNADCTVELPDNWAVAYGKTEELEKIYDYIYKKGPLLYEIEEFDDDGNCRIRYFR